MGRYAFLVMVTSENNNKFYEMVEQDNGTIDLYNGRVDVTRIQQDPKPISQWDKIYNSKVKKGYVDVTNLVSKKVSKSNSVNYMDIKDTDVRDVINKLMAFSNKSVDDNYSVKASSVTKKQVEKAQELVDAISKAIKKGAVTSYINPLLISLYTTIPRKMAKVQDHLINCDVIKTKEDLELANKLISHEQDLLDSMASSVNLSETEMEYIADGEIESKTILDALGIEIQPASDEDIKNIKNHLGEIKDKFRRAFVVTHKVSKDKFDRFVEKANDKKVELFWHGSRNENWVSILRTSLLIRPSGAIHTGSMFSDGVYFSPKARKSFGYTSGKNSYWCKGTSDIAYMAVFKVHVGNQKHIYKHDSSCYNITEQSLKKDGFDSVYAHGGYDLINDEHVVYNPAQCTIKFLVELNA